MGFHRGDAQRDPLSFFMYSNLLLQSERCGDLTALRPWARRERRDVVLTFVLFGIDRSLTTSAVSLM